MTNPYAPTEHTRQLGFCLGGHSILAITWFGIALALAADYVVPFLGPSVQFFTLNDWMEAFIPSFSLLVASGIAVCVETWPNPRLLRLLPILIASMIPVTILCVVKISRCWDWLLSGGDNIFVHIQLLKFVAICISTWFYLYLSVKRVTNSSHRNIGG